VATLSIAADTGQFRQASAWLSETGAALGVPPEGLQRLDLCLNEALANVVGHGRCDAPIELRLDTLADDQGPGARVTVIDQGPGFDATLATGAQRPASLAEAEPGGLGLLMIRSFSDTLDYRRLDGRNHLSFGVRWAPPG
jgi:anti-sigma regulatory factor (Ser/Thr protein kinase)